MRRIAILVVALAAALPTTALAVWGGQEDVAHPGVGAMYFDVLGNGVAVPDGLVCSGSYACRSKDGRHDVFLTAGHCLPPAELEIPAADLLVSFDRDARNGVPGPIEVSAYHQMPGFGRNLGDLRDLGILLLPAGSVAAGIPAVQLPKAGYLDELKADDERTSGSSTSSATASVRSGSLPAQRSSHSTASDARARRSSLGYTRRWFTTTSSGMASAPARVSASVTPVRHSSTAAACLSCRSRASAMASATPTTVTTEWTRRRRAPSWASS
jgi:hypothetical protein